MRINNDDGYKTLEITENMFIYGINEWPQLSGKWNWRTFTLINLEFEDDISMGGYEFKFILLGLGFCWRWNHTETDQMLEIKKQVDSIKAGTAKTEPYEKLFKD